MLVPQSHKDPLRRVALLAMARAILIQILIDDPDIGIQLRSLRPFPAAISRRYRMPKHLPHRLLRNTKLPGCLSLAQAFNMACQPHAQIKLHGVHLPPSIPERLEDYRWQSLTPPAAGHPPLPWSKLSLALSGAVVFCSLFFKRNVSSPSLYRRDY